MVWSTTKPPFLSSVVTLGCMMCTIHNNGWTHRWTVSYLVFSVVVTTYYCYRFIVFSFKSFTGLSCICKIGYYAITTEKTSIMCQQCPADKPVCATLLIYKTILFYLLLLFLYFFLQAHSFVTGCN